MKKHKPKRSPKFNSTAYYIEEVVRYRSEYEAGNRFENGYPLIVTELLLATLISVRAIRFAFCFTLGVFLCLLMKMVLVF